MKGKEGKGKGRRTTYLPLFGCLSKMDGNTFPFVLEMKIKERKETSYNIKFQYNHYVV